MNIYLLDRAVLLILPIVYLVYVVGVMKTAVPRRIRRLYPYRVNWLSIVPFSTRWQKRIAPEHVDAYRKQRKWVFAGLMTILTVTLLKGMYFEFFFMRLHGFNVIEKNSSLHRAYTALRPENDADKARAAILVRDLQHALAKYEDYHVAEADGFHPLTPKIKVPIEYFEKDLTKCRKGVSAPFTFSDPDSLLYERTPGGSYKLIGAMYTDRTDAGEDKLNERVPLSVARWHRYINLCGPSWGADIKTVDWSKFESIATKQACDAAGGRFEAQLPGWTLQVHPWEQNPKLVWAQ